MIRLPPRLRDQRYKGSWKHPLSREYSILAEMEMQLKISRKKHKKFVGKIVEVLIEGESEETELLLQGRMAQQAPEIDGLVLINDGKADVGSIVRVKITDSLDYDLIGEIVG